MKKTGKRWLALILSAALLIGSAVSGLVLPAAAETTPTETSEVFNFFPDGDFESGSVDFGFEIADGVGLNGSKALVIPPNTSNKKIKTVTLRQKLVPGTVYVLRYKVKSLAHSVYWTDETYTGIKGSLPTTKYSTAQGKFIQMQYMFTPVNETDQFAQFGLYNTSTTENAYVDEFEIYEYKVGMNLFPDDDDEECAALPITSLVTTDSTTGEFTIYPGGVFSGFVKSGVTVADAQEGNNNVIKFSGLGTTEECAAILTLGSLYYNKGVLSTNHDIIISFRYKSENDAATAWLASANSTVSKMVGDPTTTAPDAEGWRTHTARLKLLQVDPGGTVRLYFKGANEVLIDDFYCGQSTNVGLSDLTWTPNGSQLQTGTELQFSVNVFNDGTVDLGEDSDITVDFVANKGETPIKLGTVVHEDGLQAGESVTLTLPNKWTAPAGEWVVSAHANTTYGKVERIATQGHFRVADTALEAPIQALAGGFDTLAFSDEFDIANVDTEYTGDYGYKWYLTDITGVCGDKTDYSITDGVMTLAGKNMRYNWLLATMDGNTAAGWHGFQYGYLEFRTRFNSTPEGFEGTDYSKIQEEGMPNAPAVWSFPPEVICQSALGFAQRYVEMDWMEYWGYDKNNCQWTITLHDQTRESNGTVTTSINNRGSNHILDPKNNIGDGQWHTVGYRWEKGLLIAYVDGREIFYQDWSENGHYPEGIATIGEMKADAFTPLDNQLSPLILAGSEGWPLEIDYIRVWQKNEQDPHAFPLVDDETTMEALHWAPDTTSATPLNGDSTLCWHSSNPTVASVADGVIATHREGKALITAYRADKAVLQYVVTVDRYGERLPYGDFERTANDDHKAWVSGGDYTLIADGKGSIVTEADGNRALTLPAGYSGYIFNANLEAGKTYRFSGRVKGDANVALLGLYNINLYDSTDYLGEKKPITAATVGEWVEFSYTFTTSSVTDGAYTLAKNYTVSLRNSNGTNAAYFDDLSLVETDGFLVKGVGTPFTINNYTKNSIFYTCFGPTRNVSDYTITLSSQNTSILANTSSTKLTAKAFGSANVTITATPTAGGDTLTKTVKMTVVDGRELTLNHSAVHLLTDDTTTLQASVLPAGSTMGTVTYASDNTAVATVDQNGKVTAVGVGMATITATTAEALSATCDVVVENRPTVAIDKTAAHVWVGETVTLNATATPAVAAITWESSDNTVATVQNGVVTTHKAGTATITARVYGGNTDTFAITVAEKPTVSLAESTASVWTGETVTLNATTTPGGTAITWKSSDDTVATVENGVVNALKVGTVTITATVNGGNFDTCEVTVADKPTVSITESTASVWTGETVTLNATTTPGGTAITWKSSDNTIATVTNGVVTTHKAGTATITATVNGGNFDTCEVTVTDKPTVSITESTASVWTGETVTLNATTTPGGTAITWESSDNTVATVQNGVVTTHKAGTATITATVNGGNFDTCEVTVTDKPTVSISESTAAVWTGETVTLNATTTPGGTAITWESSDNTVATVQNGVVTTHKAGTVTITATVNGGNFDTCEVTVTDKPTLESFGITMNGLGMHFPKDVEATKANVDGIRFGTKINFGEGYTTDENGVLQLPYNNEYYEVVSMGTILRRHENGTELTLENAKWKSEAYNSTENRLTCIEFAETHVVFAVNMMTKTPSEEFNAREYDARGYVQLNIDGVITTIYTELLTDSVDKAFARAMEFEIIPGEDENIYDNEE